MPYCVLLSCKNNSRTKNVSNSGISYHRFPHDPHLKEKWIDATGRQNWMPSKLNTICSQHFDPKCFIVKQSGYRYLSDKAVPTLNFVRFYVENQVNVKEEPSSDSDSNEEPTSRIEHINLDIKTEPNQEPNSSTVITHTCSDTGDHGSSQNDISQEERLKSILRWKNELIKKQKLKIKQLHSKLRRLSKKYSIVEGELKQRKIEDEQMGVKRQKYVHKEPADTKKEHKREEIEFVRV